MTTPEPPTPLSWQDFQPGVLVQSKSGYSYRLVVALQRGEIQWQSFSDSRTPTEYTGSCGTDTMQRWAGKIAERALSPDILAEAQRLREDSSESFSQMLMHRFLQAASSDTRAIRTTIPPGEVRIVRGSKGIGCDILVTREGIVGITDYDNYTVDRDTIDSLVTDPNPVGRGKRKAT